jgi:hypothetical protein
VNLKFLTAINVAPSDSELADYIDFLARELERGTISATINGDAIVALQLYDRGRGAAID